MTGGEQPISWLMFFTFGATIFIIAGACIYLLRSRTNRAVAANTLEGSGGSSSYCSGGAPSELLAISLFAFIAVGLLTGGYMTKSVPEKASQSGMVGGSTTTSSK